MEKYTRCKDMNQVINRLVKEGWVLTKNGHGRITHPNGGYITFSITPSDKYAYRQLERDVRRFMQKLENKGDE
jgi:predicted RNA binding protein YcfA (HicA-like mRNA interferase family)